MAVFLLEMGLKLKFLLGTIHLWRSQFGGGGNQISLKSPSGSSKRLSKVGEWWFQRLTKFWGRYKALVTQPMMQRQPNPTELRLMDSYIQILGRFKTSKQKLPPPSPLNTQKSPFTPQRIFFFILGGKGGKGWFLSTEGGWWGKF